MPTYEYKVIPAPKKGLKGKGIKGAEGRFSNALEVKMNEMAAEGWEFQRAETLPSIERSGLTSSTTEWRHILVFRRPREDDAAAFTPELLPAPEVAAPVAIAVAVSSETSEPTTTRTEPPVVADVQADDVPETPAEPVAKAQDEVAPDTNDDTATPTAESGNISVPFDEPSKVINSDKS